MSDTANRSHTVRECGGHFHVMCCGDDLAIEGDPFKSSDEAQRIADLLENGGEVKGLLDIAMERMLGVPKSVEVDMVEQLAALRVRLGRSIELLGKLMGNATYDELAEVRAILREAEGAGGEDGD